jgi:DNA-binding LacI/PurR family transcriptional regulator
MSTNNGSEEKYIGGRKLPHRTAAAPAPARRATIADVAEAAGVSRTTVSYVLSDRPGARVPETTRRRIAEAAERIGYRRNALAAAVRTGRLNTVGIVAPFATVESVSTFTGNVYYKDLTVALAAAAFHAGLNPLLLSEDHSRALSLSDLTDRRADGVILIVKEDAEGFVTAAEGAGVPCVVVGRSVGRWQVHTDNALGARLAVAHLWDHMGHRCIAHFWYGKEFVTSARERRTAFRAAMAARGAAPEDAPEFLNTDIAALIDAVRAPGGPTAVFCYNDELAVELLDAARGAGIAVPGRLSVVGFDDNILAHTARPRLTSVLNPLGPLATAAVDLVRAQIAGASPPPAPVLIPPTLSVRESTGPARTEDRS